MALAAAGKLVVSIPAMQKGRQVSLPPRFSHIDAS